MVREREGERERERERVREREREVVGKPVRYGTHPLMDGHPHRCSTDFEQTLLGGHLTRRAHESTSPLGYASILGETMVLNPSLVTNFTAEG